MSIACSFSVPTTIGASRTAVPVLISAFSLTGGLQGASGNQTLASPATGKIGSRDAGGRPRPGKITTEVGRALPVDLLARRLRRRRGANSRRRAAQRPRREKRQNRGYDDVIPIFSEENDVG